MKSELFDRRGGEMDKKNRFGKFIANLRKERGITQEELSKGLCSKSEISRFERGERLPDKLMQNRFLTRLGVAPENYENFLYYKEYCRWEKRQEIIHYILDENMEKAKELLTRYFKTYDMKNPLEKQYYLAMFVQIRRYEKCEKEELKGLFKEALELTVPEIDILGSVNKIFSLEEINLLLEYISCNECAMHRYEELLAYIDTMDCTQLAMSKIYPKTVYYYYTAWNGQEKGKQENILHMLELCNKAIELLRDANRLFYMWELFCMKEELANLLNEKEKCKIKDLEQCHKWRKTLESIYQDAGVSIAMHEFCYLYIESENYCIGDVIRIRRKMLGMSQEKLAEGICDPRRVSKLERNITRPQREIVQQLFNKLNLSMELNRTELVTDNPEAVKLYRELRVKNNFGEYEEASRLLEELKNLVSEEIPANKQIILRIEANNEYAIKKLSKEMYIEKILCALECTLPYEKTVKAKERYLTNEELYCIQNIAVEKETFDTSGNECMDVLLEYCEQPKYPENNLKMYQFLTAMISCYMGNIGEFARSNNYEHKNKKLLLKNRKLGGIHEVLYELLWNYKEECIAKCIPVSWTKVYSELQKCINICELTGNIHRKELYETELEELYPRLGEMHNLGYNEEI